MGDGEPGSDARASPQPTEDTPSMSASSSTASSVADSRELCEAPFDRLPEEIIQQIFLLADPDSFASLILINSKWRRVSQQAHLYAHQLSKCPSFAASHAALSPALVKDEQLPKFRKLFAREVKRNLFQAYLRPSETRIKLISNSISSASCPGGEGLRFSPSPKGHHILAYNSSRIYVIDVRGPDIDIKRELKILRRPVSACIKDDATILAVLSMEMQVDIFDLKNSPPKRVQSILLDHKPRTIALSPCGSVLAAAYEGGIEVSSLNPDAITSQRAVKCDAVDSLAFSHDGTQLLGTTTHSLHQNTVILTAPYYDPGSHMAEDSISALWTTSILFPNSSRDCSHAILIQDSDNEEASWTFTYDRSFETFRAVRIDDLRNGTTYFTGPLPKSSSQTPLLPSTLPSASYNGELVSAGFQGKEVWLYGIPEDLAAVSSQSMVPYDGAALLGAAGRRSGGHSPRNVPRLPNTEDTRLPKWQVLCDNQRNTLISGQKITELEPVTHVKWVTGFGGHSSKERLIVTARGVNGSRPITEEEDIDFMDGGIVSLLDFDYGFEDGKRTDITIEVGTDHPEVLEEEQRDLDTEVALVRRRTVAQRRGGSRGALQRMATTAIPPTSPRRQLSTDDDDDDPLQPRRIGVPPRARPRPQVAFNDDNDVDSIEEQEALDAPYTQSNPRSVSTLRRAATAAAMSQRIREVRFEYRRADGRREHPHESDADNWVPPPPPYQKDVVMDLPAFLRHPSITPANLADPHNAPLASSSGQGERSWARINSIGSIPPVPAIPRQFTDPGSMASASPLTAQSGSLRRNNSESSSQRRRPLSDTFSDARFTVSTLQSPTSASVARYWDGEPSRRLTQSPVSDSATETLSYRYSIRGPYSNPLALNPPFRAATAERTPPRRRQQRRTSGTEESNGAEVQAQSPASSQNSQQTQRSPQHQQEEQQLQRQQQQQSSPRRGGAPILDLHIPSPTLSTAGFSNRHSATFPRESRSDLTPLAARPQAGAPNSLLSILESNQVPSEDVAGYPRSAPARAENFRSMTASWLPVVPGAVAEPSSATNATNPHPRIMTPGAWHRPPSPPDQPLIISTPTGVSGAYDPPERNPSQRRSETPVFAPTPRRPQPRTEPGVPGPSIDRIESYYNTQLGHNPSVSSRQAKMHRRRSRIVRRTASRRSVARSVKERRRGKMPGAKNGGAFAARKRGGAAEATGALMGWNDAYDYVLGDDKGKDKKCIIM
ncbi:hypothetical protein jhhlp_007367 [Lomentospora prolificans]|uniref:F-box domain-containing protein n=1 Tax=Lomentospora prolificans TaxID=41688 RepID=A0A2N3N2G2_9PEZI|nr:hypothetical protein jhhlp_007367 [Lomentospora prolificans]